MNSYLLLVLVFLLAGYFLDTLSDILNMRNLKNDLPEEFQDLYDSAAYARSLNYQHTKARFSLIESSSMLLILVAFILAHGFNTIDTFARSFQTGEIVTGLIFTATLAVLQTIIHLPFSLYSTFSIEERFGFNRMTIKTFVTDMVKNALVLAVLGGIVFSALILFFQSTGSFGWLYAWGALTIFVLILQYVAPAIYLPLFNKFTPLADGELKQEIDHYAERQGFKLEGMYTMDGSKRSSKANAFFAGIGRFRKLVLYDTLIEKHTVDELVAVMAHEIGHFKRRHVVKQTMLSVATNGLTFFLFSLLINNRNIFDGFGMQHLSVYASLIFATILFSPFDKLISIVSLWFSRKYEFEADHFAASTYGRPQALVSALKRLSVDSLSHLTPHKLKVILEHDHPPVLQRIEALQSMQA